MSYVFMRSYFFYTTRHEEV